MPTFNNTTMLFNDIISKENLYQAYKQTQKGKSKYKTSAILFRNDEIYNLNKLRESLIDDTYEFDGYTEFKVLEPKERIINAPFYKDKIVQIAINNILKKIYYPSFIYDSYSCIDNKGTHKCAKRIQKFMKQAKWKYTSKACIIKIDIKKFFYKISRDVLKSILPKKIKCQKTLDLIFKIIDSADVIDILGLPLGNTLSQICANIYMDKVDQYAKRKLSIKYYVRYADDIIIIVENKQRAKDILNLLTKYINKTLLLSTNQHKTKIFPIEQGINAIGYKIYTTHMLLRNDSKKKIKRKLKSMPKLILQNKMTVEKAEQILNSWKGHADYACSYNFIQKLIKKYDFLYLNNNKLKINVYFIRKREGDYNDL